MRFCVTIFIFVFSKAAYSVEAPLPALTPEICIKKFADKIRSLKNYSTLLLKTEFITSDETPQKIKLEHDFENNSLSLTYLNEGHSGIKNNGMKVVYDGTPDLKITLGKSSGFATLFHPFVSLAAGKTMKLIEPNVVDEEVFNVNRSGFTYLARLLDQKLNAGEFDLSAFSFPKPGSCDSEYRPKEIKYEEITLKPSDDIFALEEKMGQLNYIIYRDNKKLISKFANLFDRKKEMTLRVGKGFTPFDVQFEGDTSLPSQFTLYYGTEKLGVYQFSETVAVRK